jgi:thiol-disulfide isomerase/thioredoxin
MLAAAPSLAVVDMLQYVLRDLRTTGEVDLADYRGKISLLMFFEPDCEYCLRETRVLNTLVADCPGLQPIAIGVNGSRAALQQHMRRMRTDFPVAQINEQFQADIGEIIGTPLLLLSDRDGALVTWLRGYQSESVLRELIGRIDPATCTDP